MDLVFIAVWAVIILVALGLLVMLVFGARSVAFGKIDPRTMAITLGPVLLLIILGFVMGDWARAGIYTVLISIAAALLALLASGVRGLFA